MLSLSLFLFCFPKNRITLCFMAQKKNTNQVTLGLIQMTSGENPQANLAKALRRIRAAAEKGARIVCLGELFRSRYFCQSEDTRNFKLAETIPGPATEALASLAREREVVVIASIFEKRSVGIYHNTAVVIDADGALVGLYRKMHIPDDPLYYEKFYFTPGDLGFPSFQTRYAKIGVLVCWDQWFPEGARLASLSGAQILFYPTAIGWIPNEPRPVAQQQRSAWELNPTFARCGQRCFRRSHKSCWPRRKDQVLGNSFVAGPFGEMVARAGDREDILIAKCDLTRIEETRQSWPFLRDRRIDAYGPLQSRFLESTKE